MAVNMRDNNFNATVVIPTHNATWSLKNAITSALLQDVDGIEILVVGDGATAETQEIVMAFVQKSTNIKFLDLPKSPNRGEYNRDVGVKSAQSENIFYLADDDLFLPNHVSNLLPLLRNNDLVQSLNGFIDSEGQLALYPTDLSQQDKVDWHMQERPRNCVSITGTAHKKSTYLRLDSGWEVPPQDVWPDLHLWRKFFNMAGFKGQTHAQMTTIQFPSHMRKQSSEKEFRIIYEKWLDLSLHEDAEAFLEKHVRDSLLRTVIDLYSKLE